MLDDDPNRQQLMRVAQALDGIDVVFVGGAIVGLMITDPDAPGIRSTKDVDVIVDVLSLADYQHKLRPRLIAVGFSECTDEGAPMCRWVLDRVLVDVVPVDPTILGFKASMWFEDAVATAERYMLDETALQVISAPCFLATKFDAFSDRGDDDYLASHDIEDIIAVIDGRPEIVDEVSAADGDVGTYAAERVALLTQSKLFRELIDGNTSSDRVDELERRVRAIAAISRPRS